MPGDYNIDEISIDQLRLELERKG